MPLLILTILSSMWRSEQLSLKWKLVISGIDFNASFKRIVWIFDNVFMSTVMTFIFKNKDTSSSELIVDRDQSASVRSSSWMLGCLIIARRSSSEKLRIAIVLIARIHSLGSQYIRHVSQVTPVYPVEDPGPKIWCLCYVSPSLTDEYHWFQVAWLQLLEHMV